MTNKSDKKQQKITPASHGDELDVLEALYVLGKKKGLELLNDKQLSVLEDSNRISKSDLITNDKELDADEKSNLDGLPLGMSDNEARFVVSGLKIKLKKELTQMLSEEKVSLNEKQMKSVLFNYFKHVYGASGNHLYYSLIGKDE